MRSILLIISICLASLTGFAKEVQLIASFPKVVAVGERFQISYQLNEQGKDFKMPTMKGFRVLAGPNVSNGSSTSWINGQVSHTVTQTYSFIVEAQKAGKFTIPPASVKVKSKVYQSNSLKIEVVQGNNKKNATNASGNINAEDLYFRIITPKRTVYLGEPIPLTIKVFTRIDLADLQNADFPEYKGFYSQDIKTPDQISLQRENVNNTIYNTALLDKVLLYPQKTGELTINPAKIDAIVRQRVRRQRRDIFDDFFGAGYKTLRVPLKSNALKIKVKSLPANAPKGFLGAVGKFKVSASVDNTELNANDALTYKLKISGSGNLKLIEDPKITFPHDFDVWDPTVKNKISNTAGGSKGSKTYEYVIQPRHPGDFEIPPFVFTYFDIKSKTYQTVKTESFKIKVNPGAGTQTTAANHIGVSKEDVELIGKDIRFIKTGALNLKVKENVFFGTWKYWSFFLVGILLFMMIFLLGRKRIQALSNQALQKNKKAKKEAVKRLKQAQTYLANNQSEPFFEAINKSLQGYLVDKFNMGLSDFSTNSVQQELSARRVQESTIQELSTIVSTCEMARYAPSQINITKEDIYQRSIELISELESQIKNTQKA